LITVNRGEIDQFVPLAVSIPGSINNIMGFIYWFYQTRSILHTEI